MLDSNFHLGVSLRLCDSAGNWPLLHARLAKHAKSLEVKYPQDQDLIVQFEDGLSEIRDIHPEFFTDIFFLRLGDVPEIFEPPFRF